MITNTFSMGLQAFITDIIKAGKNLDTWVSCNYIAGINLGNTKFTIGGVEKDIPTGVDLLQELHAAAKAGKLTEAEGQEIVNFLSQVSWRFVSPKTWIHYSVLNDVVEEASITEDKEHSIDLLSLSLEELRSLAAERGIEYHPAAKQKKLIELLSA